MSDDAATRLAINDLVARYCDAVARADATAFAACWTLDAHWTGPGLDRRGAEAITGAWTKMRARFTLALQAIQSGTVQVDGTDATGTWWVRETLLPVDGDLRHTAGRYQDAYVRTADGWRFARRAFTPIGGATAPRA